MPKISFPTPSRPFLYLPDGWDTVYKAGKAAIATAPCGIHFIGDSITSGTSASDFMVTSYPARLRATLAALYPTNGDFYSTAFAPTSGFTGSSSSTAAFQTTATANITYANGNTMSTIAAANAAVAFGATGDLLYTSPTACTSIDLVVYDIIASTFQFNVDGGVGSGTVTISSGYATPTTGASTWTATMQNFQTAVRITISGLANTAHTVRIGGANAVNGFWVMGCISYTGTTGGMLYGFNAAGGGNATTLGKTITSAQLAGKFKTTISDATHPTGFGFPSQAHLNIYEIGVNDCTSLNSAEQYINNVRKTIQGLRRGRDNCSIMLVVACNPDADNTDVTSGFGNPWDWPRYIGQMKTLCDTYNCALANVHAKWGETPFGKGFIQATGGHPTDAGYTDMASLIAGAL